MKFTIEGISRGKLKPEQAQALQKYVASKARSRLSKNEREEIYATGYTHYLDNAHEEALASFSQLLQRKPRTPKYWIAIGATLQKNQNYAEALAAYALVLILEENHIPTLLYSAQCALKLGEKETCRTLVEQMLSLKPDLHDKETPFAEKARSLVLTLEQEGL